MMVAMEDRERYTVRQVAEMAGVSVRTLHHYDQIGLLEPAGRTPAGYRLYGAQELLRLQQILLFRGLGMPLREIGELIDAPGYSAVAALRRHAERIDRERERLVRLRETIERTIIRMTEDKSVISNEDLYEGIPREKAEAWDREARERWGDMAVDDSWKRIKGMTKARWQAYKEETADIPQRLAALMDRDPEDAAVQEQIARHFESIRVFYEPTPEIYRGLGMMYVEDARFTAFYGKYAQGLAAFMQKAMAVYADRLEGK